MRIVVTGASGFVGRRIVVALAEAGHDVVAASRQPCAFDGSVVWRKSPDLDAAADWADILTHADAVVHAAARVHVMTERSRDPLSEFRRVNVDGTVALARQAIEAGVRRFVFISTIKVNGERTVGRPFSADDPASPADPYGMSKWEAEQAIAGLAAGTAMEATAIRPVLVHGAGVKGNMAMLAGLVSRGVPLPLGAVRNRRSLVHVDNLASLVTRAVSIAGPLPAVLLIRDDESPSTPDLLRRLARAGGRSARLLPIPSSLLTVAAALVGKAAWADRLLWSLEVDDTATRIALGWHPPVGLDRGLLDTIDGLQRATNRAGSR